MDCKHKKALTSIELIMMIVIIAVLAAPGAYLMRFLVQNSVFIPNKLNMDMLVTDALNIMIEGDSQAKGLRFSRIITAIAPNEVTFINQASQTIRYRFLVQQLYRTINGVESLLPYYIPTGVTMVGKSGVLFIYRDSTDAVTAVAANVRRIEMALISQIGTGLFQNWEAKSEQNSSIAVKKYQ